MSRRMHISKEVRELYDDEAHVFIPSNKHGTRIVSLILDFVVPPSTSTLFE